MPAINFYTKFREEGKIAPKSTEEGDLPFCTSRLFLRCTFLKVSLCVKLIDQMRRDWHYLRSVRLFTRGLAGKISGAILRNYDLLSITYLRRTRNTAI